MGIYERIKKYADAENISINKLEKELGFARSSMRKFDINKPSIEKIKLVADRLNVSVDLLLKEDSLEDKYVGYIEKKAAQKHAREQDDISLRHKENSSAEAIRLVEKIDRLDNSGRALIEQLIDRELERIKLIEDQKTKTRHLAYYGKIAAAGTFIDSYELLMHGTIDVEDDALSSRADYAIGVSGDSMEPKYRDGDVVLVRKTRIIDYGDVGIFQYNGDIYIKELSRDGLKSLNDRYPVIRNNDDIRCLGHVIGKAEMIK